MKSLILLSILIAFFITTNGKMVLHYGSRSSVNHNQIVDVK